mmetsp:Transcript_16334/g.30805  ORF Transcript_16334/g.30805 Transcript_16334/m.30805 type:complete len:362 (-) Transcript_16334:143-1228(-)|eukprot:CAMPEP_0201658262 /NCGR_PEP_ID=MMETSP0494-20130426/1212_1 /ASSEMBLY_ACC=CAM_ASM_000839 /TAXON_ID=420259 /ORGANISM="Thalassiosira gravida, Strain GMp14c1" /LENGTH=361 /DNA_ID=CAMNT_0048135229 /DNA_START=298 /DNA_END=1383 /DNA_ORIENTATION=-
MTSFNNACTVLIGTLTSISGWQTIQAFAPSNCIRAATHSPQPYHYSPHPHHPPLLTQLNALIYYPDDSTGYEENNDIFGPGSNTFVSTANDYDFDFGGRFDAGGVDHVSLFGQLANQLSSDSTITAKLAKLASAYSPPGHAFDLRNVNDVRCSSLDNNHMEIEAVVCGEGEEMCSSLLVPVPFPEECAVTAYEGMEECVLRNVDTLDDGVTTAVDKDVFQYEDEAERAFEALSSLDSSDYLTSTSSSANLPKWWESPKSEEDITESELLQALLNGNDLQDIMHGLATHAITMSQQQQHTTAAVVQSVKVKAVGPLGIMLKVQLLNTIEDVFIKYEDMSTTEGYFERRSIREEVLRMVSLVS